MAKIHQKQIIHSLKYNRVLFNTNYYNYCFVTLYQIVGISFGSERKTEADPMEGVLFYGKDDPEFAKKWPTDVGTKRTVWY